MQLVECVPNFSRPHPASVTAFLLPIFIRSIERSITSSKDPVPGGGAASALVAIVGNALVSMVSALTVGKKGYEQQQSRIVEIGEEALRIKRG